MPFRLAGRTFRLFTESRCPLWASALTYYSIFSIVPILALTFGLSKGFGLEEKIYEVMNENFANHKDILDQVMEFTGNMLERTKGGIVAGVGVVVLIYSVISMIRHIEKAVENVLGIHSGRKFLRVVTDYLALLLICPVLLVIAGSVTLLFNSFATDFMSRYGWLENVGKPVFIVLKYAFPCIIAATFCMLLFMVLSNGKMRWVPAMFGGLLSSICLQLLQSGYFYAQKYLTSYNAIYGSFAALPLFLIYIYATWNIIMLGVAFASAIQGWKTMEFDSPDSEAENYPPSRRLLLLTAIIIGRYFATGRKAPCEEKLATLTGIGLRRMRICLTLLTDCGVILYAKLPDGSNAYVPALPPEKTTIGNIIARLDANTIPVQPTDSETKDVMASLEKLYMSEADKILNSNLLEI